MGIISFCLEEIFFIYVLQCQIIHTLHCRRPLQIRQHPYLPKILPNFNAFHEFGSLLNSELLNLCVRRVLIRYPISLKIKFVLLLEDFAFSFSDEVEARGAVALFYDEVVLEVDDGVHYGDEEVDFDLGASV